jgi:hypothetical protein
MAPTTPNVEPAYSLARAFDWHDYLRAIEWRCPGNRRGACFSSLARSILQVDSLVIRAHPTDHGEVGRLTIGFHTSLTARQFARDLMGFARRFSGTRTRNDRGIAHTSCHCSASSRSRSRSRPAKRTFQMPSQCRFGVNAFRLCCRMAIAWPPMRSFIGPTSRAKRFS